MRFNLNLQWNKRTKQDSTYYHVVHPLKPLFTFSLINFSAKNVPTNENLTIKFIKKTQNPSPFTWNHTELHKTQRTGNQKKQSSLRVTLHHHPPTWTTRLTHNIPPNAACLSFFRYKSGTVAGNGEQWRRRFRFRINIWSRNQPTPNKEGS